METEIELKYLIDEDNVEPLISELFRQENIRFTQQSKLLKNCYFDTKYLELRRLDMGLRVRAYPDYREQTIKTAGKVIGGLHQRPEYNVTIQASHPDLSLFPKGIWPNNYDLAKLQDDIVPLFSTNFERKIWHIIHPLGEVELAFDTGQIESGDEAEVINEIELELLSGDIKALFSISTLLFTCLRMRPGRISKAARGYAIWHKINTAKPKLKNDKEVDDDRHHQRHLLAPVSATKSPKAAFFCGVEFCLTQIQESINAYINKPKLKHLFTLRDSLQMLSHGVSIFSDVINGEKISDIHALLDELILVLSWLDKAQHVTDLTIKSGNYRKKLEYSKQLIETLKLKQESFPQTPDVIDMLQGARFNQLQLSLLGLLLEHQDNIDTSPLKPFAYQALEQSLVELVKATPECDDMAASQYLELKQQLTISLITGSWFGELYSKELRKEYRSPWLDILYGIDELAIYALLQKQLQQLEQQPQKLIQWLDTKIDNLVDALEYSRKMALSVTPYWHVN